MRSFIERWWYGRDPIIGIDIREDRIVFADVDVEGGSRWLTFENHAKRADAGGLLGNAQVFISNLQDFIAEGFFSPERCAVGVPESFIYVSRVSLPEELTTRSERVRYEAALERVYLRPHEVRGCIYPLRDGYASVLVVAAKVSEVEPLEDAVRSVGIELACLTPRVVALHHLATLSRGRVRGDLTVYCDPSVSARHFHVFKGGAYYGAIPEWHELLRELNDDVESQMWSTAGISLIMRGDPDKEMLLRTRYGSAQATRLSDVSLPVEVTFAPDQVAAGALSLWEAGRG